MKLNTQDYEFFTRAKFQKSGEAFLVSKCGSTIEICIHKDHPKAFLISQNQSKKRIMHVENYLLLRSRTVEAVYNKILNKLILIPYGLNGGGNRVTRVKPSNNNRNEVQKPILVPGKEPNTTEKVSWLNYSIIKQNKEDAYATLNDLENSPIIKEEAFDILRILIDLLKINLQQANDQEAILVRTCKFAERYAYLIVSKQKKYNREDIDGYFNIPLKEIRKQLSLDKNPKSNKIFSYTNHPPIEVCFRIRRLECILSYIINDSKASDQLLLSIEKIFERTSIIAVTPIITLSSPELRADLKNVLDVASVVRRKNQNRKIFKEMIELDLQSQGGLDSNEEFCDIFKNNFTKSNWLIQYHAIDLLCNKVVINYQFTDYQIAKISSFINNFICKSKFRSSTFLRCCFKLYYFCEKFDHQNEPYQTSKEKFKNFLKVLSKNRKCKWYSSEENNLSIVDWCSFYIEAECSILACENEPSYTQENNKIQQHYSDIKEYYEMLKNNSDINNNVLHRLNRYIESFEKQVIKMKDVNNVIMEIPNLITGMVDETKIIFELKKIAEKDIKEVKEFKDFDYGCYVELKGSLNTRLSVDIDNVKPNDISIEEFVIDFISKHKKKIMLMTGYAGSGKTMAISKIEELILEKNLLIPIKIPLQNVPSIGNGLIEEYIIKLGFNLNSIKEFMRNFSSKLIILLDAYDEASCKGIRDCSLFSSITNLKEWKESKFIITCRSTAAIMTDHHNYWKVFCEEKKDIVEINLDQFNSAQRIELFNNFNKIETLPDNWTVEKLDDTIQKSQTLSSIKQTPFNLKIIFKTFPKSMFENESDIDEVNLIKAYIDLYIDRALEKRRRAGKTMTHFKHLVIDYCKNIASVMIEQKGINSIKYEYGDKGKAADLLDRSQENISDFYDSSPLAHFGNSTYGFTSIEFYGYFTGLVDIDKIGKKNDKASMPENQDEHGRYITEIELSNNNQFSLKMIKNDPKLQLDTIKSLINSENKSDTQRLISLLVGVSLVKPSLGDREKIEVQGENQTSMTLLGDYFVVSFKDGSIKVLLSEEKIIRKPCSDITRTLIPSNKKKYLVGLSDNKMLTLYYLSSFDAIRERLIIEGVTWLTTCKFSDDDSKLFVAFQSAKGDVVLIFQLEQDNLSPFEIVESEHEIQDIILSPWNSEYCIILKEFSNCDIYQNEKKLTSKQFSSGSSNFCNRIIQKIKIFAKCNSSLTTTQKMFEKLELIENDGLAVDKNTNQQIREIYVNLQGAFEQLFAHFLENKVIVSFIGGIHTKLPATPLCKDHSSDKNNDSMIIKEMRQNVKQVLMIEARAKIINTLLSSPCVDFHSIYPKRNKKPRGEAEMKIYKKNLETYKNLYDNPLDIDEEMFDDRMIGATYLFKLSQGEWYCFSLQGRQALENDLYCEWCIWFGQLQNPKIIMRVGEVADYLNEKGFNIFRKLLDQISEELSINGNNQ